MVDREVRDRRAAGAPADEVRRARCRARRAARACRRPSRAGRAWRRSAPVRCPRTRACRARSAGSAPARRREVLVEAAVDRLPWSRTTGMPSSWPDSYTCIASGRVSTRRSASRETIRMPASCSHPTSDEAAFLPPTAPVAAPPAVGLPPAAPEAYRTYLATLGTQAGYLRAAARTTRCRLDQPVEIVRGNFANAYLGYSGFADSRVRLHDRGGRLVLREAFSRCACTAWRPTSSRATCSIALVKRLGFELEGMSPRYLKIGGAGAIMSATHCVWRHGAPVADNVRHLTRNEGEPMSSVERIG